MGKYDFRQPDFVRLSYGYNDAQTHVCVIRPEQRSTFISLTMWKLLRLNNILMIDGAVELFVTYTGLLFLKLFLVVRIFSLYGARNMFGILSIVLKMCLSYWGRVKHICVIELTIVGSDNVFPTGQRHAIVWTKAGIILIGPLETNFSEIVIEIYPFSVKKMLLNISGKRRPFCLGLKVLSQQRSDVAPSQQQQWYLPCRINGSVSSTKKSYVF